MTRARIRTTTATIAATAALLAGCGGEAGTGSTGAPVGAASAEASGACAAEEHPPLQAGSHLIGDAEPPVPYSSVPPTSGWHASGVPDPGVHTEPLTDPAIVSLLEIGLVVAVYDPERLDADGVADLAELATSSHAGRLNVAPSAVPLPTALTLTAWGVLQRCDEVAPDAVTTFVLSHYGQTEAEH